MHQGEHIKPPKVMQYMIIMIIMNTKRLCGSIEKWPKAGMDHRAVAAAATKKTRLSLYIDSKMVLKGTKMCNDLCTIWSI
jgi:hypothetical protein